MFRLSLFLSLFAVFLPLSAFGQVTALVNGTILDFSNSGNSNNDTSNSVLLFSEGKITSIGAKNSTPIPADAKIIDVSGKYIIPGLIDGYGTINNQSYANAYLYLGVTSVVATASKRRGELYLEADPAPGIIAWASLPHFTANYNQTQLTKKLPQLLNVIKNRQVEVLQLMYQLNSKHLKYAIDFCRANNISTVGELGRASVKDAIAANIQALIHTQRYLFDLAPANLRQKVLADPFGEAMVEYNNWLISLELDSPTFANLAWFLGESRIALMPILGLYGNFLDGAPNPWLTQPASILNLNDIHMPVSKLTGLPKVNGAEMKMRKNLIGKLIEIEKKFYRSGARYLAGSGCDVFGTMPGISLHREIELLTQVGLSNREAIAAATSNFSELLDWQTIGKLNPGYRADILVLNKNPLDSLKNLKEINLVFVAGEIIQREELLKE